MVVYDDGSRRAGPPVRPRRRLPGPGDLRRVPPLLPDRRHPLAATSTTLRAARRRARRLRERDPHGRADARARPPGPRRRAAHGGGGPVAAQRRRGGDARRRRVLVRAPRQMARPRPRPDVRAPAPRRAVRAASRRPQRHASVPADRRVAWRHAPRATPTRRAIAAIASLAIVGGAVPDGRRDTARRGRRCGRARAVPPSGSWCSRPTACTTATCKRISHTTLDDLPCALPRVARRLAAAVALLHVPAAAGARCGFRRPAFVSSPC